MTTRGYWDMQFLTIGRPFAMGATGKTGEGKAMMEDKKIHVAGRR